MGLMFTLFSNDCLHASSFCYCRSKHYTPSSAKPKSSPVLDEGANEIRLEPRLSTSIPIGRRHVDCFYLIFSPRLQKALK